VRLVGRERKKTEVGVRSRSHRYQQNNQQKERGRERGGSADTNRRGLAPPPRYAIGGHSETHYKPWEGGYSLPKGKGALKRSWGDKLKRKRHHGETPCEQKARGLKKNGREP